jgi:hypothetical protein
MLKLPGWPLIHQAWNLDRLDAEVVSELARRNPTLAHTSDCAIATLAGLTTPDFRGGDFSIAILACGGFDVPELPKSLFMEPVDKPLPLLLVDFEDRHHPDLWKAFQRRYHAYRERGWPKPGVTPTTQRVADFLKLKMHGGQR